MTRAFRGLIRVNRAIALLTMVGASWRAVVPTGIEPFARGAGRYGRLNRSRVLPCANRPGARGGVPYARNDNSQVESAALPTLFDRSDSSGLLLGRSPSPRLGGRGCCGGAATGDFALLVARVAVEGPRRRELP